MNRIADRRWQPGDRFADAMGERFTVIATALLADKYNRIEAIDQYGKVHEFPDWENVRPLTFIVDRP